MHAWRNLELADVPGLTKARLIRLLTQTNFLLPRFTITCVPDENGRELKITYRVYDTHWLGDVHYRAVDGFREVVETVAGDTLSTGRKWDQVSCDRIEWDTRTGEGRVYFHPSNPQY